MGRRRDCSCTPETAPCTGCQRRIDGHPTEAEIDAGSPFDSGWQPEQDSYERQLDLAGGSL